MGREKLDGAPPEQLFSAPAGPPLRRWWRELALAGGLYAGYDIIRASIAGSTAKAERDGHDVLRWEQLLHLDPEGALNRTIGHVTALAVPGCYFYATLHFLVTGGVLLWTYHARPSAYRQARTVLAVISFAALIGFWWFPTAPPRLLTGAGFQDTLAHFAGWGWWGSDASVPAPAAAIANQYAAMPSLHLAWAAWSGGTVYSLTRRRSVRLVAVGYPLLTALVVLATANHYLLDVLAAAALWALARALVGHLARIGIISAGTPGQRGADVGR